MAGPSTAASRFLGYADLLRIVEKSALLHERTHGEFRPADSPGNADEAERRIARWRLRVAGGDEARFHRRLSWDGISMATLRRLAAGVELRDRNTLPPWAEALGAIVSQPAGRHPDTLEEIERNAPFLHAGEPVPFEHVLIPFVEYAARCLRARAPAGWRMLSVAAQMALERDLLSRLSAVAQNAFRVEFGVWRSLPPQSLAGQNSGSGGAGTVAYRAFALEMLGGRLAATLRTYPVLGRMLAERTCDWIAFACEFLDRLTADHQVISASLGGDGDIGAVVRLRTGLSDVHNRGRSVLELEFENGAACVYKPRNIEDERRFQGIIELVNGWGVPLPFRLLRVLPRGEHGWAEAVHRVDCHNEEQVRRHFTRVGMLLCLLFLLEGNDCHAQNMIADGEFPALVDTETLLSPALEPAQLGAPDDGAVTVDCCLSSHTVLRCGILPKWVGKSDRCANVGALADVENGREPVKRRPWADPNTGLTRSAVASGPATSRLSTVCCQGREVSPSRYTAEIVAGFRDMYRIFLGRPAEFVSDLPRSLLGVWPRFVFRNTSVYSKVLEHCCQVHCLSDGLDVTIEADVLCRRFLFAAHRPAVWSLIKAEHHALTAGDIPRFLFNPEDNSVYTRRGGKPLSGLRLRSGLDAVQRHLRSLSAHELDLQAALIRLALNPPPSCPATASGPDPHGARECHPSGEYLEEAVAIGRLIESAAITVPGGKALWLSRTSRPESEMWQMEPMSPRLYDGLGGVGLFLAALERATGAGFHSMAMAAFRTVQDTAEDACRFLGEAELGAGTGVGSVIYALARAGYLLGEPRLVTAGERIAASVGEERISQDRYYDVIRGSAGLLLSLLALHNVLPRDWILERARVCGDHLLKRRTSAPSGLLAWRTIGGNMLCGLSHGAAGIAYALRRLASLTGCSQYRLAAWEAESYENALYCERTQNWPDLLASSGPGRRPPRNAWCHGAAGIILARLGAGDGAPPVEPAPVRRALESLLNWPPAPLDHLCCGNGGRIETLLEAGRRMDEARFLDAAANIGRSMIERARQERAYRLGGLSTVGVASFHQGLSGIGYQWLRLHSPDRIPSALLWA